MLSEPPPRVVVGPRFPRIFGAEDDVIAPRDDERAAVKEEHRAVGTEGQAQGARKRIRAVYLTLGLNPLRSTQVSPASVDRRIPTPGIIAKSVLPEGARTGGPIGASVAVRKASRHVSPESVERRMTPSEDVVTSVSASGKKTGVFSAPPVPSVYLGRVLAKVGGAQDDAV